MTFHGSPVHANRLSYAASHSSKVALTPRCHSLQVLLLLIQQEHHHHQEDEEEERPSRYLREAPLSHPLSLILSYNNI